MKQKLESWMNKNPMDTLFIIFSVIFFVGVFAGTILTTNLYNNYFHEVKELIPASAESNMPVKIDDIYYIVTKINITEYNNNKYQLINYSSDVMP